MFQIVDCLTIHKKPWEELSEQDKKAFNIFMLNRIFSMSEQLVEIVNFSQIHSNIPSENIYKFWLKILPKEKIHFNLIKKDKKKDNQDLLDILADFFQVSTRQMSEDISLLSKADIEKILYGVGIHKNQIKKMLKS